jgi:hypothetical protein
MLDDVDVLIRLYATHNTTQPTHKQAALEALKEIYEGHGGKLPDNTLVLVKDKLSADPEHKKEVKNVRA